MKRYRIYASRISLVLSIERILGKPSNKYQSIRIMNYNSPSKITFYKWIRTKEDK